MLKLIAASTLAAAFLASPAFAADNAQQNKMAACNKEAGEKKGDERKAFMSQCLSAKKKDAAAPAACEKSADEKKLAGAARSSHIKKCAADMAAKKP
jgi:hypothetical protein